MGFFTTVQYKCSAQLVYVLFRMTMLNYYALSTATRMQNIFFFSVLWFCFKCALQGKTKNFFNVVTLFRLIPTVYYFHSMNYTDFFLMADWILWPILLCNTYTTKVAAAKNDWTIEYLNIYTQNICIKVNEQLLRTVGIISHRRRRKLSMIF